MNLIILGASTTAGKGDAEVGGWSGHLRRFFEKKNMSNNVFILGIPGETTEGLLGRIKSEMSARYIREGDICMIAAGTNDSRKDEHGDYEVSPDKFSDNVKNIIDMAKEFTRKIIIIGPSEVDERRTNPFKSKFYKNKDIKKFSDMMKNIAEDKDVNFLDMTRYKTRKDNLLDGLHPTPEEHQRRYQVIVERLENEYKL